MRAVLLSLSVLTLAAFAADDVVFADFEGDTYGDWKAEGEAFGPGPAKGALPGQMHVEGFAGKGLVNSFFNGDRTRGRLVSPEFTLQRKSVLFLIGGGAHEGKTCVNLVVDGKVVRSTAGPNAEPGGSERLEQTGWDVSEFAGKRARIEIVDDETGGWGHVNADHFVFSDRPAPKQMKRIANVEREIPLAKKLLLFPVKTGAKKHRAALLVDGRTVREFEIELSAEPDWWAHLDVSAWNGKTGTLRVDWLHEGDESLARVMPSDEIWDKVNAYREPLRPLIHWSPMRGWVNDPNGMVWAAGEYHLYFQHNPYGWAWGNMHWGHAVSRDLVHWEELPIALYPQAFGDWAFSGSAVVDAANTSGWKTGKNDLIVGAYTSTGRGECMIYSNDLGRTWAEFEGNPVVKHTGRDPRLLWYAPGKHWIMALYSEAEGKQWITFHTSPDLKKWTYRSRIEGFFECPDLFELPYEGGTKWVLTAASSEYMVGTFDGATFTPETPKLPGHRGRGFYAAQTFTNEPRGRIVQMGWMQAETRGMPFNQAMSLPLELSLRKTPDGPRLAWRPVGELAALRASTAKAEAVALSAGLHTFRGDLPEAVEFRGVIEPGRQGVSGFNVRGVRVAYDPVKKELLVETHRAPVALEDGKLDLVVYVDRSMVEVFANGGITYVPLPLDPKAERKRTVDAFAEGDGATFKNVEIHELRPIWGP